MLLFDAMHVRISDETVIQRVLPAIFTQAISFSDTKVFVATLGCLGCIYSHRETHSGAIHHSWKRILF